MSTMIPTRWVQVVKNIWQNKERSVLVILSIAVGVAAVGAINNSIRLIERDLSGQHLQTQPSSIHIFVTPFQSDLSRAVEDLREVERVEARRIAPALIGHGPKRGDTIDLNVAEDFTDMAVGQIILEEGNLTPGLRQIMLERTSAEILGLSIGDTVIVEMSGGLHYELTISGIVHDLHVPPYSVSRRYSGYLSMETLVWMGQPSYYNRLDVLVNEDQLDRNNVLETGSMIKDRVIEPGGHMVGDILIPGLESDPGEFWAQNQIDGAVLILQVMGAMAIFLSGGLVVNTISAMLAQQIAQIGIMRSIGAVRRQLIEMYLANVLVMSLTALVIAIPLALIGSWWLSTFSADFLNFNIETIDLSWQLVLLMIGLGLMMPQTVALYPIIAGTRISVYDAIYQYGLSSEGSQGWIEHLLTQLKMFSPPARLSLRNTFRKKARLVFTLITLTMAGAMFVAVFSTRVSLSSSFEATRRYFAYDTSLAIPGGANWRTVERETNRVLDVEVIETFAASTATVILPGGREGDQVTVYATPHDEIVTIDPFMLEGRWLTPDDVNGVVVNEDLVIVTPHLGLNSTITLDIAGQEREYRIVGITSRHLIGNRVYMTYPSYTRATGRSNQVDVVHIRASENGVSSAVLQDHLAEQLEVHFDNVGLSDRSATTHHQIFGRFTDTFDVVLVILVAMALILVMVGSLSLTGTMGMNVLERTKEIGVLRAVGASNQAVRQVVVVEGIVVGLISFVFVSILSWPVGYILAREVVRVVLRTDLNYYYSYPALIAWLAIVIVIGIVSSLAPARRAVSLTVREVLDYE